jgi:hypothetical protein
MAASETAAYAEYGLLSYTKKLQQTRREAVHHSLPSCLRETKWATYIVTTTISDVLVNQS